MRLKILSKWPLSIVNLAGIIFSLMIILFPIFNSFGQSSYTKADSPANSQAPQNLVDDKPVKFTQVAVSSEQVNQSARLVSPTEASASLAESRRAKQAEVVPLAEVVAEVKPAKRDGQTGSGLPASPASPELGQDRLELGQSGPTGRPINLKIPKINVDAPIKYVGLDPLGAMDVPKGPADVAWFELGTRPGDNGSAVIAGHYGRWKNGEGSVFDDLNKLSAGDRLYVEDDQGVVATFVVRASRIYDPKADASDVFSSNDGESHLNLIACDGVWDKVSKSYSERLVVFADKVDSTSSPQE